MEQKEILEGNKLIAEFNGHSENGIKNLITLYGELKYHSSWDWLMPVVEKIESLKYEVEIQGKWCIIVGSNNTAICENKGATKIECVYLSVIEFIKHFGILYK